MQDEVEKAARSSTAPPAQGIGSASAFFSGFTKSSREAPRYIASGLATSTDE